MAGPAIRALELCRAVARSGTPATLATLASCDITDPAVDLVAVDEQGLRARVGDADVVLLQGDVLNLHRWLAGVDLPIVVDAYDPFHFEQLEQARGLGETRRRVIVRDCVRTLSAQFARADLVLAASIRQRDMWLGHLAAVGRVNPVTYDADHHLGDLLRIVPFGLPDRQPLPAAVPVLRGAVPGIGPDAVIALWAGGLYDWFDPLLVLEAFAGAIDREPRLRLVFLGAAHPVLGTPTRTEAAVRARSAELGLTGTTVHFVDRWIPYDKRGHWLAEADLAVVAHHAGLETEFAFRTRVLDHLWAGLPTVGTTGDVLVNDICAAGGGLGVEPGDRAAFTDALLAMAQSPADRAAASAATMLIAEDYRWDRVADGLVRYCRSPDRAPDLVLPSSDRALLGVGSQPRRSSLGGRLRAVVAEGGFWLLARRLQHRVSRRTN